MDGARDSSKLLNDTYNFRGDTRISAPGTANWRTGVESDLDKLFKANAEGRKLTLSLLDDHSEVPVAPTAESAVAHPNEGVLPNTRYPDMSAAAHPNEGVLPNERYMNSEIENIINQGDSSPVNVAVEQDKGWGAVFDELRRTGTIDIPTDKYKPFMRQVWPELKKLAYDDKYQTPVAYLDRFNRVRMNTPPYGTIHPGALRLIAQYASRNNYDLVA
jgi:hypothetical protein